MQYKQTFSRLYPDDALGNRRLDEVITFLPDGSLKIALDANPDVVELDSMGDSSLILAGDGPFQVAETLDTQFGVELQAVPNQGHLEYWVIQSDRNTKAIRRVLLNSKWDAPATSEPRIAASPGGKLFVVDDGGTVRLYHTGNLKEAGTFQMANAFSGNRVVALAVSLDDRYIAVLSRWKDVVLYEVPARKVVFVRHIADEVGWYDSGGALILLAENASAIVTAGISWDARQPNNARLSVNVFQLETSKAAV